jgi:hypothetical protein
METFLETEAVRLFLTGREQQAGLRLNDLDTDRLAEFANTCSTLEQQAEIILQRRANEGA